MELEQEKQPSIDVINESTEVNPQTPAWIIEKSAKIQEACQSRKTKALKSYALSKGGLLTDELRQQAWPLLLGDNNDIDGVPAREKPISWQSLPPHHDEGQVDLDVNRSFVYYPTDKSDAELKSIKQELSDLIVEVLRRHPYLHYFQGYHDICQVLLLVLPQHLRAPAVRRLSLFRIRDFMLHNLGPTIAQLHLIPDLLDVVDPKLRKHLSGTDPFYALAGTLTMYAHDIERYGDISRLFDAFLATPPVFSVYMFAQIILSRRDDLLDTPDDDQSMLHYMLSKLPQPLDLEGLISGTIKLLKSHPPKTLPAWKKISSASCLKTYKKSDATIKEVEEWFQQQTTELEWTEFRVYVGKTLWKYRKPAQAVGAAIAVGLLAVYLRKNPAPVSVVTSFISRTVF